MRSSERAGTGGAGWNPTQASSALGWSQRMAHSLRVVLLPTPVPPPLSLDCNGCQPPKGHDDTVVAQQDLHTQHTDAHTRCGMEEAREPESPLVHSAARQPQPGQGLDLPRGARGAWLTPKSQVTMSGGRGLSLVTMSGVGGLAAGTTRKRWAQLRPKPHIPQGSRKAQLPCVRNDGVCTSTGCPYAR
jgi:hypothetical protein